MRNYTLKFKRLTFFGILVISYTFSKAQKLDIINSKIAYKKLVKVDSNLVLVNIKKYIPNILIDLRYATTNNFMSTKLYKQANTTYLLKPAAEALLQVQHYLNILGFRLKIFDAYRPYSITKKMWGLIKDERYVANPKYGSGHNKGISVDVTIVDLKTNKEIDMGTGFDNFTDSAHHTFTPNFNTSLIKNRNLLKETMEKFGFKALETEWWHYAWQTTIPLKIFDLSFKELKKVTR
jgi:zinc D-Ala-D-Ala dipeptidase